MNHFSDGAIGRATDANGRGAEKKPGVAVQWGEKAAAFYLGIPIDF